MKKDDKIAFVQTCMDFERCKAEPIQAEATVSSVEDTVMAE